MELRAANLDDAETRRKMLLLGGDPRCQHPCLRRRAPLRRGRRKGRREDVRRPRRPAAERLGGRRLRIAGLVQRRLRSRRGRARRLARRSRRAGARAGPGPGGAAAVLHTDAVSGPGGPRVRGRRGSDPLRDHGPRAGPGARPHGFVRARSGRHRALDRCHGSAGGRSRCRRRRTFRARVHLRQLAPPPGRRSQPRGDRRRHLLPADLRGGAGAAR